MLCEKCKNKKATVFYADEGGGRHSLCAACASGQGKTDRFPVPAEGNAPLPYLPDTPLTVLLPSPALPHAPLPKEMPVSCPKCGKEAAAILREEQMGCPDCYTLYASLFPMLTSREKVGRMPQARRQRLEKDRRLALWRTELRQAVESEHYEQAAALRDRIKALETSLT